MIVSRTALYLLGAEFFAHEDEPQAEKFYSNARTAAILEAGAGSAELGIVLEQYADFLQSRGRVIESAELDKEIRAILQSYGRLQSFG